MINSIKIALLDLDGTLINVNWRKNMGRYYRQLKKILTKMGIKISYFYAVRWASRKMMNDDSDDLVNIEKYFKYLSIKSGLPDERNREIYSRFYKESFSNFQGDVREVEGAHELLESCKKAGMKIVLATNPVFPLQAVKERLSWGGFNPDDFDLITSIENFSFCKPNPRYFLEICKRIGGKPGQALMVGDDYYFDIKPCLDLGINTWWYKDKKTALRKKTYSGRLGELIPLIHETKSNLS